MPNRPIPTLLALFALACTPANPSDDAGSTSTRSETTGSDSTDTGPETTTPWCCWCDEQGEIRCVDETGPGECKAFGADLGVDVVETGCTGLPGLGTLDCPGLVCDGGTTETGEPPLDIPFADTTALCCTCPDPETVNGKYTCWDWTAETAESCTTAHAHAIGEPTHWCEAFNGYESECLAQC